LRAVHARGHRVKKPACGPFRSNTTSPRAAAAAHCTLGPPAQAALPLLFVAQQNFINHLIFNHIFSRHKSRHTLQAKPLTLPCEAAATRGEFNCGMASPFP
jgi:hypothetical protein